MIDIESSALVERLINDLQKTTDAYQKSKNEMSVVVHENKLNQQALIPLQKENERLAKENNHLHLDVIKAKEELEQVELKWKSSMRQLQNECQDLRFLVEQKDLRIQKMDQELSKMRSKMDKVLTKTYMPSQDEVIEGLGMEIREHNILNGTQQEFEITHPLQKQYNDISGVMRDDNSFVQERGINRDEQDRKNKVWAEELSKADERCEFYRRQGDDLQKRKLQLEESLQQLEKQVIVREEEIKRLHHLYEGGQNLEKLNMRYLQDTNEKAVAKLQNQVDFLNKENHKLTSQVDLLRGDKTVVDEISLLKGEINDLAFENQTLRKDLRECTSLLKDFQEKEFVDRRKEQMQVEENKHQVNETAEKMKELADQHDKLKLEQQRIQTVKAAYNADKQAYNDRISDLELQLNKRDQELQEFEHRLRMNDMTINQFKGEINFLNGKCTTLKRDLEYQERYVTKFKDENFKIVDENDLLKQQMNLKEKEQHILKKQVSGLQEDNDRINRMYQVVEKEQFLGKPVYEDKAKEFERERPILNKGLGDQGKWKVVDDDFGPTGNYGKKDFKMEGGATTVKRSNYV